MGVESEKGTRILMSGGCYSHIMDDCGKWKTSNSDQHGGLFVPIAIGNNPTAQAYLIKSKYEVLKFYQTDPVEAVRKQRA